MMNAVNSASRSENIGRCSSGTATPSVRHSESDHVHGHAGPVGQVGGAEHRALWSAPDRRPAPRNGTRAERCRSAPAVAPSDRRTSSMLSPCTSSATTRRYRDPRPATGGPGFFGARAAGLGSALEPGHHLRRLPGRRAHGPGRPSGRPAPQAGLAGLPPRLQLVATAALLGLFSAWRLTAPHQIVAPILIAGVGGLLLGVAQLSAGPPEQRAGRAGGLGRVPQRHVLGPPHRRSAHRPHRAPPSPR